MKICYYPGCTLKHKARNLEATALASLAALDMQIEEMERWNCCGAVYSLTNDDLIHMVGPARNLIRAKEMGAKKLVTLCSMCYNTLARVNLLMKNDEQKRNTINSFMDDEIDYFGEIEVVHFLSFLKDDIGWQKIKEKVQSPLSALKIAPYYGCTLQRPESIAIEPLGSFTLMTELLEALGAQVTPISSSDKCCGSYQILCNEPGNNAAAATILNDAIQSGANALVSSCPLCEFNLGKEQQPLKENNKISKTIPTFYFTQILALALGVIEDDLCLDLNDPQSKDFLLSERYLEVA